MRAGVPRRGGRRRGAAAPSTGAPPPGPGASSGRAARSTTSRCEGTFGNNPARANKLLDEAGWTQRDAEGFRTKDGKRLTVRLVQSRAVRPRPPRHPGPGRPGGGQAERRDRPRSVQSWTRAPRTKALDDNQYEVFDNSRADTDAGAALNLLLPSTGAINRTAVQGPGAGRAARRRARPPATRPSAGQIYARDAAASSTDQASLLPLYAPADQIAARTRTARRARLRSRPPGVPGSAYTHLDRQVTVAGRSPGGSAAGGGRVLWAAATAAYLALLLAPGDTVDSIIGDGADTPQIRAQIIAEWGLDRPDARAVRSTICWRAAPGRPRPLLPAAAAGRRRSWASRSGRPSQLAARRRGCSACVLALVVATVTAGPPLLARRPGSDRPSWCSSRLPPFLIGIVLLAVFSFQLGLVPGLRRPGLRRAGAARGRRSALPIAGVLGQVLRDGLERALEEPFAVTARARGIGERGVVARHALRHALLPGGHPGRLAHRHPARRRRDHRAGLRPSGARPGHRQRGDQQGHARGAGGGAALGRRLRDGQHARRPRLPARSTPGCGGADR